MNSVENANSQSHERFREINHLLPFSRDCQASYCQISFLKRKECREDQQPAPKAGPKGAEKPHPWQKDPQLRRTRPHKTRSQGHQPIHYGGNPGPVEVNESFAIDFSRIRISPKTFLNFPIIIKLSS